MVVEPSVSVRSTRQVRPGGCATCVRPRLLCTYSALRSAQRRITQTTAIRKRRAQRKQKQKSKRRETARPRRTRTRLLSNVHTNTMHAVNAITAFQNLVERVKTAALHMQTVITIQLLKS